MKFSCQICSFLLVEDGEVPGDVLPDCFDFSEFSGTARGGLGVSEGPKFVLKLLDIGSDGLSVGFSYLVTDFLFNHFHH